MIPTSMTTSGAFVLRKMKSLLCAGPLLRGASASGRMIGAGSASSGLGSVLMMFLFVVAAVLAFASLSHSGTFDPLTFAPLGMAFFGPTETVSESKKPTAIRQAESELRMLAKELEQGQIEMAAGPIPPKRGEELEEKAKEMEALQNRIDKYNRISGVLADSKKVDSPTLPTDSRGNRKRILTTPGHLFVGSEQFRQFKQQGQQSGFSGSVSVKGTLGRNVALYGEEAVAFEAKAFSEGQLSTLGTDAIVEVDRDRELVRFEEPEVLTIRDVLNSAPTTSDSIRYVRHTATVRAADVQATRGAAKSYLTVTFAPEDVSTATIAVLAKVTEQDVDDAPRLVGYINGEMSLDVNVKEEQQLLWGLGSGGQIKGLFVDNDVPEYDRAGDPGHEDDTVIDVIRRIRTDLRKKHVTPSFALIDPLDWEDIELAKGTDDRYIWGLITNLQGPRIWSMRVVESDAMTNLVTGERRVLVGDGVRGATIYDRHDIRLAIGFVNDDFERNLRTLRAEKRLALAVKRPYAFEYAVTAAGES